MAEEPPVTPETPESPETPETPETPESTEESINTPEDPTSNSEEHNATRNTVILVVVIAVVIAVVLALFFGLRGCNNDEPDDVNPNPDIVEPGPEVEPDHTHEYGDWQYDDTYHWKECECGEVIDKAVHTLDYTEVDSTYHKVTCEICGYEATSEHTWVWEHDASSHWQVCTVCGATTTAVSHELSYSKNDSESHNVTCEICGYETTGKHTFDGYVSDGADGHYQVCSECGETTSDVAHELSYVSVDATYHHEVCSECDYVTDNETHSYAVTGQYNESVHYIKCSVCGYEMAEAHTFTQVVTAPTCTNSGYTTYTCACGYSYTSNYVSASGHSWGDWEDKDNDDTNHTRTCSVCGTTQTEEHNYELTDTVIGDIANAKVTDTYTCTVCGHQKTVEETYDFKFATDSWDVINQVCTAGYASTYYAVGDTKEGVSINGESHTVRIIDFDHDTLTSSSSAYNGGKTTAAMTVEMATSLPSVYSMNESDTNSGGWVTCHARTYTLPQIFNNTLDSNLQSVIKQVVKTSTKGNNSEAGAVSTSNDNLFLLARGEIEGGDDEYYSAEGTQYQWYEKHNTNEDRRKNNAAGTSNMGWWTRSASKGTSPAFQYVSTRDNVFVSGYATNVLGLSFAFCI